MTAAKRRAASDALGSLVANALWREGIFTVTALYDLRQALGAKAFEDRISDIRTIGKGSMVRIREALDTHERLLASGEAPEEPSLDGCLPEGLMERLRDTLHHLEGDHVGADSRLLPDVRKGAYGRAGDDDGGSLTVGDLAVLNQILGGHGFQKWDMEWRNR